MLKKGELTVEQVIGLVIAAAGVFVLLVLLGSLIAPYFGVEEETTESYRDGFLDEIVVADSGGVGSFEMWQPREEGLKYSLVYFGSHTSVADMFYFIDSAENKFCFCSRKDGERKADCSACGKLDHALVMGTDEIWVVGQGDKITIELKGDVYEVTIEGGSEGKSESDNSFNEGLDEGVVKSVNDGVCGEYAENYDYPEPDPKKYSRFHILLDDDSDWGRRLRVEDAEYDGCRLTFYWNEQYRKAERDNGYYESGFKFGASYSASTNDIGGYDNILDEYAQQQIQTAVMNSYQYSYLRGMVEGYYSVEVKVVVEDYPDEKRFWKSYSEARAMYNALRAIYNS